MAFLEKPITLQKLLRAVEQGLAKPSRPGASSVAGGTYRVESVLAVAPLMAGSAPLAAGNLHNGALAAPAMAGLRSEQVFELDRPLREARDAFEKSYFEFHLAKENGSMTRVAEKTGLERTHLYRKLKQLGVDLTRNKRGGGL
jgi:DNA-binding NtrC family response regulator